MPQSKNPLRHQKPKKRNSKRKPKKHFKRFIPLTIVLASIWGLFSLWKDFTQHDFLPENRFTPVKIEVSSTRPLQPRIRQEVFQFTASLFKQTPSPTLLEVAQNIQKKWGFESVDVLHTAIDTLWVRVQNRVPVAQVQIHNTWYPMTAHAQVYKGQEIAQGQLFKIQGVFASNSKLQWNPDHSAQLHDSEKSALLDALKLQSLLEKNLFNVAKITHQQHRGYHISLHNKMEITFGYTPFEPYIHKLLKLQTQKGNQWNQIQKIELDFQGKVFIAYKS